MTPAPEKTRWTRWRTTPGLLLPPPLRRPLRLLRLDGLRPAGGTVPSPDAPPFHVRVRLYRYRFTTREERRAAGDWWHRTLVREQVGPTLLERGPRRAGRCPALRESRPGKSGNGPLGAGHRGGRTARARPADLRGTACGACCVLSTRARTSLALDALGRFGRAPRVGAGRRGPTKIRRTAPRAPPKPRAASASPARCPAVAGSPEARRPPRCAQGGGRRPRRGPPGGTACARRAAPGGRRGGGPDARDGAAPGTPRPGGLVPGLGPAEAPYAATGPGGRGVRAARTCGGAGPVRPGRQSTLGRMCGSARSSS
ncbi:lipase maturation factor family protein [Streptomyces diastaticus]|uniref:lipase maturation factor family protein n=1 Tax=Streptomyces diastaticus TaxID=1956 RepID=UPI00364CB39C